MPRLVVNTETIKQLASATGVVELVDDEGRMIGHFMPAQKTRSVPLSPEQIEKRRKELEPIRKHAREHPEQCKTLKEIMANLHRIAGESS